MSAKGTCSTCGAENVTIYGGEGRYVVECYDCWTRERPDPDLAGDYGAERKDGEPPQEQP